MHDPRTKFIRLEGIEADYSGVIVDDNRGLLILAKRGVAIQCGPKSADQMRQIAQNLEKAAAFRDQQGSDAASMAAHELEAIVSKKCGHA